MCKCTNEKSTVQKLLLEINLHFKIEMYNSLQTVQNEEKSGV